MDLPRDRMYLKFRLYGFLKNLRFFDPFIILFFVDAGLSFFSIGLLYAIREISVNVFELPTGFLADSLGRRKAMIMSFLSYLASFLIFFLFRDFWLFAVAMVFFASGEAFRSGTHKAMILDYLKKKRMEHMKVEYYGRTRSASQIGSAISALVAIVLVFHFGAYRIVFLASIVPYVIELFLMASYPAYLDGDVTRARRRGGMKGSFLETWHSFTGIFRNGNAIRGILNSSLFGGVFKASREYLQPIIKAQAIALPVFLFLADEERIAVLVGLIYFFLYLLSAVVSRNAGWFASKFNDLERPINMTFIIGGIFILVAGLSVHNGWYVLAVLAFIGLYVMQNVRKPLNVGYLSDTISSRVMASGLSVESQMASIVIVLFAPFIGWMADIYGIGTALMVVAVIYLVMFLVVAVRKVAPDRDLQL
ncbi:MAG: MFS transporter [Candidatus Thermoplasmatota archaeon]|nr:MFS transporter [Candidatus Thermoplasmatota archaeon]